MLLLGHDILRIHKVQNDINGPHNALYAHKLNLGRVIVGDICLGKLHKPPTVNMFHNYISDGGPPTLFEPCKSARHCLPNNRVLSKRVLSLLRRSLNKRREMKRHFLSLMEGLFTNGYTEVAPPPGKG